jgi:putative metalloprotease
MTSSLISSIDLDKSAINPYHYKLSLRSYIMDRREAMKQMLLLFGVSAAMPVSAWDLGKAIDAATSLGKAATLSDADLKSYYSQLSKQYDSENQVASAGSKYGKRLAALTKGLNSYDGQSFNYKAYITSDVNAFAMGDGTVRIYSGLMDLMTDDEVRYVIAHEMGHIKSGHSKKRMQAAMAASSLRDAASAAGGRASALSNSQLGDLFHEVVLAQHSQSNEREADDYALQFLQTRKNDPMAAVTALEKLDALSGGGGGGWTSTHPAPKARANRMRKQLNNG